MKRSFRWWLIADLLLLFFIGALLWVALAPLCEGAPSPGPRAKKPGARVKYLRPRDFAGDYLVYWGKTPWLTAFSPRGEYSAIGLNEEGASRYTGLWWLDEVGQVLSWTESYAGQFGQGWPCSYSTAFKRDRGGLIDPNYIEGTGAFKLVRIKP